MLAEGSRPIFTSGECEIDLARRELRVHGSTAPIGGRAFEVVEVLVEAAGKLVTKNELMKRVWPGAVVTENTLHVHAGAVRKALGPYRDLLRTESGRGYRLLGDWSIQNDDVTGSPAAPERAAIVRDARAGNFPAAVARLVGRSADMERLQDLVSAYRVLTLVGPGGIGKTTLALEVARHSFGRFADGGRLVELASLSDPDLVPSAVAGALGLELGSDIITPGMVARAIAGKHVLLVLDNCEHVVAAAAAFAEILVRLCPGLTILATSREIFRIDGECVYRVPPLDLPLEEETDAAQILRCSGPEMFIARAGDLGVDFSSRAANLPLIGAICRRLDGIPLAIEFAAARAATLGIEPVAAALSERLALLTSGRRSALPRHRTLRATLDWSYDLLTDDEQLLLRRLAVFCGGFSLEAAEAVANRGEASAAEIADRIADLVAKSLISADIAGGASDFRLLETTRAYALARLTEGGELPEFSRRHAEYYRRLLENIDNERDKRLTPRAHLDNVRAALEWCFADNGDPAAGVGLAAAAAPVFLAMSLFRESRRWSHRAILALDDASRGGRAEMHLQASLGVSTMQLHGQSDLAEAALQRSLAIAETRGEVLDQVGLLGTLSMFRVRDGDFTTSLEYARRSRAVGRIAENSAAMALANSILGRALQFVGDHAGSRAELESSFRYWSRGHEAGEVYLGLDHHILVGIGLARHAWLCGYPAQARERVGQTVKDASRKNHPASLGLALSWAPGIFLWLGDARSAEEHAEWLIVHAASHALEPYLAVGRGYRGVLAIARGDASLGIEGLRGCLDRLHAVRYEMLNTDFRLPLVRGLLAVGAFGEALALADETIGLVEASGDLVHMPEVLRVKGTVLLSMPRRRLDDAEDCFVRSLAWSRRQGARSWELRTAVDLAALRASDGRRDCARTVLQPIFESFVEGFDTADLQAAERLLASLQD